MVTKYEEATKGADYEAPAILWFSMGSDVRVGIGLTRDEASKLRSVLDDALNTSPLEMEQI